MLYQFMHYLRNEMGLVGFALFSIWVVFLIGLDMTIGSVDFDREEVMIPPSPITPAIPPAAPPVTPPAPGPANAPNPREEDPPSDPPNQGCLNVEGTQLCLEG